MPSPCHDLARILALAQEMTRPDVSAQALAASCGPVSGPLGQSQQLNVQPPGIAGVTSMTVLPEGDASGPPGDVMFNFARDNEPRLSDVSAVFGQGEEVDPMDREPVRVVFKGPASAHASVRVIADVDDAAGNGGEPFVSRIAFRRDRRVPVQFDLWRIFTFAAEVARSDATTQSLASAFGTATPREIGCFTVYQPNVPGVSHVGTHGPPYLDLAVIFGFNQGNRPRLSEVEANYGKGKVVAPVDWEPWRVIYKGPANAENPVHIVVKTDAVTGNEKDPFVTEIAIRRITG